MAAVKSDPHIAAHLEWIGFVRPTGLVVSAPALVRAGAILNNNDADGQRLVRACVPESALAPTPGVVPCLPDFRGFAESALGWSFSPKGYAGTSESPIGAELEVVLAEYGETLRPDFAVRDLAAKDGASPWQLLVRTLATGQDFDHVVRGAGGLEASAHGRMERMLRQAAVPAGLLFNGHSLRLISAPRGESSGWIDFKVADMLQVQGRPICAALRLLLCEPRLLTLPRQQRLAALLEDSRKFQNEVSERLAEQVLHALYELLRGFQAANDVSKGELLREVLADHSDEVYRSLLTVVLRLVFLLYAEERDMLPEDEIFLNHYSLAGLYERLRGDAALFPDTMDQRFGAWAQLLVLFRMVHDGAEAGMLHLPKRHGVLFDPDRFKFLEGRHLGSARQILERIEPPRVPDGTIYRALEKLLVLDGERISYRALDVEQIGSVYETMMGFRLETALGPSVAIRSQKRHGAPTTVNLEALLGESPKKRDKWLLDQTDRKLSDKVKQSVAAASTVQDLHAALSPVIDVAATPDLVREGGMVLQPSEERRRSGSHYTPRALTEPIVRTTLEPILARLHKEGELPRPEQILDLKVCDPAMGSGAFLVEACRQLGDALVESWRASNEMPTIPPDEDEVIFARRIVAQRCLYGVDRNPVAVDLAKVSLWLVTLAREHALTFVDHALRHGDSLVGLTRRQIEAFHWEADAPEFTEGFEAMHVREHVAKVADLRRRIREADENMSDDDLRDLWDDAQHELHQVRFFGDLAVAGFFDADKDKERESKRRDYAFAVVSRKADHYRDELEERRHGDKPLVPFHWEIEFPEVFERVRPGFDAIVGNPPFLGGKRISGALSKSYSQWIIHQHDGTNGNADLVAHFFRRAFNILRRGGAFGLLATNTIAQGDTREGGLAVLRRMGGVIFSARRRIIWPGQAAVIVAAVHLLKDQWNGRVTLDGRQVSRITAFLFYEGSDDMPPILQANKSLSYIGCDIKGHGFLFDDRDSRANPIQVMRSLLSHQPSFAQIIKEYIGGDELNNLVTETQAVRYVIDFNEMSLEEARKYPEVLALVHERVRPGRERQGKALAEWPWWQFWRTRRDLREAINNKAWILVNCQVAPHVAFIKQSPSRIFAHTVNVFPIDRDAGLSVLQSRPHDLWARFFGSSMKDDLRYTPSDCFETFPFPDSWESNPALEAAGKAYYAHRAALMVHNNEGLTKTYNRFHYRDEDDPAIHELRRLHTAMDEAVLAAYGWRDIPTSCEFLLDYEVDEDEQGNKKKPWRCRWPDAVRDEVLARLLELNASRAKAESLAGAAETRRSPKSTKRQRGKGNDTLDLFGSR